MKQTGVIIVLIVGIALFHYLTPVKSHHLHAIFQRLFYLPIILAAFRFGLRGGLVCALVCALLYAPHILFQWHSFPQEAFIKSIEIAMFAVVGGVVGVLADIQQHQHRQLLDAQRQVRRMDRLGLLGQLASGLAHEIRNPLGALIGSAEILDDAIVAADPNKEFVRILRKELVRLRDTVNEFLLFARPAPAERIPNNLNDVVKATCSLVEQEARRHGITFDCRLDESMPLIPMDAEKLKQIMLNLMLNSIQALPDGGTVTVTTRLEKQWASLLIADNGPGIPVEQQKEIFTPFYSTKKEGTGLGLSIVKQLVEAVNGSIHYVANDNGACFEVRIPRDG